MSNVPSLPGWDLDQSPFHDGELAVQERVGVREKIDALGRRFARRYLTDQHREFFPRLPYVFIGSVDEQGQPWASPLFGKPGFVIPESPMAVSVRARPLYGDPLAAALRPGAEIALLGAQLHTRRRNRISGTVTEGGQDGFTIEVRQTLGLCPQYIQSREPEFTRDPGSPVPRPVHRSDCLDTRTRAIIGAADTYFVASVDPREADGVTRGADVSHRGGRAGFVRVDDETTLTAPDFVGNFIFNTLGNWQIEDRAGLLFLDFEGGDLIYIAARAEIIWEGPELRAFTGAQRLIRYHVTKVIRVEDSLPARFTRPENSPVLEHTGSWAEVAQAMDAERDRDEWRPFRVVQIVRESDAIRSFYLEPADGHGLATYAAGQFLPLRVTVPGWDVPTIRTYTLSAAPGAPAYRISVKREGQGGVSDWLHDEARVDDRIDVMSPRGAFTFDADPRRAVVMISAGVGITPFVAMLDSLLVNDGRTRHHGPIWFVHGAQNSSAHAFAGHVRVKAGRYPGLRTHIRYSRPLAEDQVGVTHDSDGHLDLEFLKSILPFDDHEFYLCGPAVLMQELYDGLAGLGVRAERIHVESFGSGSVKRRAGRMLPESDTGQAISVHFGKSGKTALWRLGQGSLLDLAEHTGVAPLSRCRAGVCGTCTTRLLGGAVDYAQPPVHEVSEGEVLLCIAHPRRNHSAEKSGITLDL